MKEKITRELLLNHGFKSSDERIFWIDDLGYDLGIVKRAIVEKGNNGAFSVHNYRIHEGKIL